ncbi:MAG: hypothetical protein QGI68_05420 [Pseudomonadales bacterium]|jgi:hypothetical protein|nr:hypothetical protein [Pseudomonadales bacterium]MDP7145698.1 hypothetical protein [Pseudomonadales bacterium]MDP7357893.1 hypothetical protein [Pseudomonadales bacterium]MDP7594993.1 hypothetical protein [Pseudomonadales bacterium]HJN52739.1 hypothetical protein [Pseudomonadales bacterium]|tara:strand:+ start:13329 stop:14375 length:1047 start_codon:yes stop_codon:yes gene_type:complete
MQITISLFGALLAFALCHPGGAFAKEPDPLFQSSDLLAITVTGPFTTINKVRDKEKEYTDAQLIYAEHGNDLRLDVKLQVRGNFRLRKEVCRFAPLRIHFKQDQTKGTLFHKQKKLKLVTHCQTRSTNTQYMLLEYLVYRAFNLLTDYSFKVRLAEVNYVNTQKNNSVVTKYAFFIEDKGRLGKRLGMEPIDLHRVEIEEMDPRQSNLVSTFQFMIGNTDWSMLSGEPDEACCHNAKLLGRVDSKYFPIPYDFDFSGIINAKYATPTPNIPISSVRTRFYRGFCELNHLLDGTLDRYRDNREAIYSLIEGQAQLSNPSKGKARKYLDGFYELIDKPDRIEKKLIKRCR